MAFWFARETTWRVTYLRMAVGVGIGFILRLGTKQRDHARRLSGRRFHDLAWIVPCLFYALGRAGRAGLRTSQVR